MMSKETTRRKILEFERDGIISKNKKIITLNFDAFNIHRPEASIISFSRLLASVSKILYDNKITKKIIKENFITKRLKKNLLRYGVFFRLSNKLYYF